MPVYRLSSEHFLFPDPEEAEHGGLLAIGGDFHPKRLLNAYKHGIFPWYAEGEIIRWYFMHPRLLLQPRNIRINKSMRSLLRSENYEIKADAAFSEVLARCAHIPRKNQEGTWITHELSQGLAKLNEMGLAHSLEVYIDDQMIAGLYGIVVGKLFSGESMFTSKSNFSKVALIRLCQFLDYKGFEYIDCQQETDHLKRMGAQLIKKQKFLDILKHNRNTPLRPEKWTEEFKTWSQNINTKINSQH